MRKGKIAAQAAHASMMFLVKSAEISESGTFTRKITQEQKIWLQGTFKKIVVSVTSEDALLELIERAGRHDVTVHPVYDAGLTEFHGVQTLTCAAFGPDTTEKLQPITGNLPLI